MEITPKYNLLATKNDTDVTALSTADVVGKNAVIVESAQELPTDENTQVTINFQLPSCFITNDAQMDKVFVVHTKQDRSTETYKATVAKKSDTQYTFTMPASKVDI